MASSKFGKEGRTVGQDFRGKSPCFAEGIPTARLSRQSKSGKYDLLPSIIQAQYQNTSKKCDEVFMKSCHKRNWIEPHRLRLVPFATLKALAIQDTENVGINTPFESDITLRSKDKDIAMRVGDSFPRHSIYQGFSEEEVLEKFSVESCAEALETAPQSVCILAWCW